MKDGPVPAIQIVNKTWPRMTRIERGAAMSDLRPPTTDGNGKVGGRKSVVCIGELTGVDDELAAFDAHIANFRRQVEFFLVLR